MVGCVFEIGIVLYKTNLYITNKTDQSAILYIITLLKHYSVVFLQNSKAGVRPLPCLIPKLPTGDCNNPKKSVNKTLFNCQ